MTDQASNTAATQADQSPAAINSKAPSQAGTAAIAHPNVKFMLQHPAHMIALGFGSGLSRIAGKDVIAFRISYVGESASGKVDAGAGFGAEHRIQPARGRTGAPKVKERLRDADSLIVATLAQMPDTLTQKAVEAGYALIRKQTIPEQTVLIPAILLTRDSVQNQDDWSR